MEQEKHSRLGIASFITSILSGVSYFVLIVIVSVMEASTPGGIDEESVGAVIVGLLLFAFLGALIVALGLGIAGLLQKERKKIFAILGTVFSLAILVVIVSILIIGVATV